MVFIKRFWNWVTNETNGESGSNSGSDTAGERTLYLEGEIAHESWWADEVTPKMFKDELMAGSGSITVWINSPGGDVFCASEIYNMLKEYAGKVTVKINALAASAASVIAMSGDEVLISPVGYLFIHNPSTMAWGESEDMKKAQAMLNTIKEGIINAYELKTHLSRTKISHMMDEEAFLNAQDAVGLGFADGIMYSDGGSGAEEAGNTDVFNKEQSRVFTRMAVTNSLISKLSGKNNNGPPNGTPVDSLMKRLNLISH